MGTISVNRLGGISLIVGPVLALVFWLIQPGGAIIDSADPANAQESIMAFVSNSGLAKATGLIIPVGLILFLYGIFTIQGNIRGNGNGDALSRLGAGIILIAVIGWVSTSALGNVIAGTDLQSAAEVTAAGSIFAAASGINVMSGLLGALGFLLFSLALSTRDDFKQIPALVIALASAVGLAAGLWGGLDSAQLETTQLISAVVYLLTTIWSITLGLDLLGKE